MPGYWFMYNMYALARNSGKYESRDKRTFKNQYLEYDFLAPDSVNEIFDALQLLKKAVGKAKTTKKISEEQAVQSGEKLLEQKKNLSKLEILIDGVENASRKVQLVKVTEAYHLFKELIIYYGVTQLLNWIEEDNINSFDALANSIGKPVRTDWLNIGSQLIPEPSVTKLLKDIHESRINDWEEVHSFYKQTSEQYLHDKRQHAVASLFELLEIKPSSFTKKTFLQLLQQAVATKEWMVNNIYESRAKDYANPFRLMVYESQKEMEKVIGSLKDNAFIKQQQEELFVFKKKVAEINKHFRK